MKRSLFLALILLVILTFVLSFGSVLLRGKFELQLFYNGERVLCEKYTIKGSTLIKVLIRHAGSFQKFYEKNKDDEEVKKLLCFNDKIERDIKRVIDIIEEPVIDSEIIWDKKKAEFSFKEGKDGVSVDRGRLIEDIYNTMGVSIVLEMPIEKIEQEVGIKELKERTTERACFSTAYASSSANRKHNIALATSKLHGQIVPSKSEFSFNKTVGPRTVSNGFKVAGIISGGSFTQGVGGGVCQVSTTLYNAWIRAGLEAINAVNHSLPVSYVGPSFDAMVSSRNDLLLFNNTPYDIYVKAQTKENKIVITIYGLYMEEEIVLRNEIIKRIHCNDYNIINNANIDWKEDEYFRILKHPKSGLISVAYKDTYKNGKRIKSEKLRTNTYAPQKGRMVKRQTTSKEQQEEKEVILFNLGRYSAFSGIFKCIA